MKILKPDLNSIKSAEINMMSKNLKLLIFTFIFTLAAFSFIFINCSSPAFAIEGPKNSKLLFSHDDPRNDDYGPGSYTYPGGPVYKSNPDMFDITRIRIYEVGSFYRFDVEFKGKIVRSWPGFMGHRNGWLLNVAEIYIDTDNKWGSGHKKAALGRNVSFQPESYWEKMVFISPVANDIMISEIRNKTDDLEFAESLNDFVFPSNIDIYGYTLSATVNKSEIGEFKGKWGIQVLSTVFDNSSSSNTFYNKRVYKSPTDNEFGGASDLFGSPNVLDIIVPDGMSQKDILSQYRVHPNYSYAQFAVVPMVYSGGRAAGAKTTNIADGGGALSNDAAGGGKLRLNVENIKENEYSVQERELEDFKIGKNTGADGDLFKKNVTAAENKISKETPGAEEAGEKEYYKASADRDNKNNKDGEYKINKIKSDTKKVDSFEKANFEKNEAPANAPANMSANKSAAKKKNIDKYDDFLTKLDAQKLKFKNDDEEESLKDIERFLTKQSAAVYKKNTGGKNDKIKDFDPDIYEMAKMDGGKKKSPAKTEAALKTAKTGAAGEPESIENDKVNKAEAAKKRLRETEALKPLIENESGGAEETEDKSVLGRLFGRPKKKNNKTAGPAGAKKVLSEEDMVEIAKTELPENSVKKRIASPAGRNNDGGAEAEDGNCRSNMKKLYEISLKYIEQNPDAQKISMNMLITSGLLDKPLKCEDGGRYLIEVKNSKPKINCINVNNSGHGSYSK
jgi:hypothetical protein